MDPVGLAVIAALPFAAASAGTIAGRIGPRSPRQLAAMRVAGAAALGAAVLDPQPVPILAAAAAFWIAYMAGMPLQQRLWAAMYPRGDRGKLLGIVGTARYAAAGLAVLVVGRLADGVEALPIIVAVSALGASLAIASGGLEVERGVGSAGYSARASIAAALTRPRMRRLTIAQLVFGGALIAAVPLVTLVQIDRASLSMAEVGLVAGAGTLIATSSYAIGGAAADRFGSWVVVAVGAILGVCGMLLFSVASGLGLIVVATVLVGASASAIDVVVPVFIADNAPADEQAAAAAGMQSIWGLRGLAVPFAAVWPVQAGLVDVAAMLVACAVVAGIGTILFVRATFGHSRVVDEAPGLTMSEAPIEVEALA